MVEFVPVTRNDIGTILAIYNYYIENSTATFHSIPLTAEDMEEFLFISHPKYPSFMIVEENGQVGYCFLTQYKKRQAYDRSAELSIYLQPGFTRKGIGSAALRHLEAAAKASGIRMLVGTICGENHASIQLMEKGGYSRCALLKNIGEKFCKVMDVVMYQKEI
ncbi:MAG: N-acetyltransferase [Methanomicrobiales archaeon]|nr:N-acetyltransferase [Methanomicrobiales archaeon]